ncbi:MAG: ATP-binding protein [Myxococcota bacterium]
MWLLWCARAYAEHTATDGVPAANNWDVFTNYGRYMPQVRGIVDAQGNPDWLWIGVLLTLMIGILASFTRIYVFWRRAPLVEASEDLQKDLANLFLLCAICGYGLSAILFFWPGYRLLAFLMAVLNVWSWRLAFRISHREASPSRPHDLAQRLAEHNAALKRQLAARNAELGLVTLATRHTDHPMAVLSNAGRLLWCNERFAIHYDQDADALTGQDVRQLLQRTTPERSVRPLLDGLETGVSAVCEVSHAADDGTRRWLELALEWIADDPGGRGVFVQRDVTGQRRLRRERDHVYSLINASSDLVRSVDGRGQLLFDNAASRTTLGGAEHDAHPLFSRRPAWARWQLQETALPQAEARGIWIGESALLNHRDEEIPVSEMLVVDRELSGQIRSVSSIMRDITALKQAREAAESASLTRGRFLAIISHEIRTPLNGIQGALELLSQTHLSPQPRRYVQAAQASARSLMGLLDHVLDFSQLEADELILRAQTFALHELLEDVLAVFRADAQQKGIDLSDHIEPDVSLYLTGDPDRLRQILINLVGNAMKFTVQGAVRIRVSVSEHQTRDQLLRFSVHDTGPGISAADQERMFHPFSQRAPLVNGGAGLGLVISKQLVERMRGRIWLTSTPGEGTTFSFTARLQRADPDPEEIIAPPTADALPEAAAEVRVLVAEDNAINQMVISEILRVMNADFLVVPNGRAAVDAFKSRTFDIVLMDCQMPEMDGLEASRQIRIFEAQIGQETVPIVALTANVLDGDREACLDAGMTDYLSKPIDRDKLAQHLDAARPKRSPAPLDVDRLMAACLNKAEIADRALTAFLDALPPSVATIRDAHEHCDVAGLKGALHHLCGGALQVGAVQLSRLSAALEARAERIDVDDMVALEDAAIRLQEHVASQAPLARSA